MWQTEKYLFWKCLHDTELLYFFRWSFMFNVQTINRMQYNSELYNQTRSQSRNEINTHTEHLIQKHNDLL